MDDMLQQLLQEEQELQFAGFNENSAWELGSRLVEECRKKGLPVTIDISRGDHQLFHASLPGTSADNDEWIKRKIRVVKRFGHSSFYMGRLLSSMGKTIGEAYQLAERDYAAHGGCFPILVKGTGLAGTITVSGLPQQEDHKLVVQGIRDFLSREN